MKLATRLAIGLSFLAMTVFLAIPRDTDAPARQLDPPAGSGDRPTVVPTQAGSAVTWSLVGAGDIASCDNSDDSATARLLEDIEGIVFTAGDNAYPDGSRRAFDLCYGPTWGEHRSRTRPAPGNHEYETAGAVGYFDYFGTAAGEPGAGWYSYDVGSWHVVVLNSNCEHVGGCGHGSRQVTWLTEDLLRSSSACTVAYWHHSRFSSGRYGDDDRFEPFWEALYAAGTEIVVTGHDHIYERMAPQTPAGAPDPERGIRAFIVGIGGRGLRRIEAPTRNTEFTSVDHFGVLRLVLRPADYDWELLAVPDGRRVDHGRASCH